MKSLKQNFRSEVGGMWLKRGAPYHTGQGSCHKEGRNTRMGLKISKYFYCRNSTDFCSGLMSSTLNSEFWYGPPFYHNWALIVMARLLGEGKISWITSQSAEVHHPCSTFGDKSQVKLLRDLNWDWLCLIIYQWLRGEDRRYPHQDCLWQLLEISWLLLRAEMLSRWTCQATQMCQQEPHNIGHGQMQSSALVRD